MAQRKHELGRLLGSPALRYRLFGRRSDFESRGRAAFRQTWTTATDPQQSADAAGRMSRVEAVLFLTKEPLSSRKLAQLAKLADGTEARTLVGRLNGLYDSGGRSFRVENVAGGYQLLTRPKFAAWLRRMAGSPPEFRLSGPAMETLAVVAYRQPVLRAEIEAIRGVQCGEILRQLMERNMVRIAGRAEELGRPFLYGTTKNFLQVFGLRNLDELPRASMLRKIENGFEEQPTNIVRSERETDQNSEPGGQDKEESVVLTTVASLTTQEALEVDEQKVATVVSDQIDDDEIDDDLDDDDDDDDYDDDDDDDDMDGDDELDDDFEDDEWEEVEDDEEDDDDWDDDDDDDWDDDDDDDWDDDD
jgi:segregation and condensation protein B